MTINMLLTLPLELLHMIIGRIVSRGDLKRLCEVCTRLHDIAIPHLYRSLVLSAPELSLKDLVTILEKIPRKYLKHTQELGFSAPIHDRVESRCVHHIDNGHFIGDVVQNGLSEYLLNDEVMDYETLDGEDIDESTDRTRIAGSLSDLSYLLNSLGLPEDHLRSFRWEVGTCIPEPFFFGSDSFLRNQSRIQSITFITDGECGANKDSQYFVDLVQFRELRSLSWRGLNRYNDFESVRECVNVHGHQIQSLTLDLLTWTRAEKIWADGYRRQQNPQAIRIPDNFFSQIVLNVHPRDRKVIFPSLENLHLSAVSFCHTGMEMAYAFNVGLLKSLKLRNCPKSLDWLRMILDSGKPMKLKSFELALDLDSLERYAYLHITETVCKFIQQISDLETLFLMLPEPIDWTALTDILSSHRLKRFVVHHLVDRGGQKLIDGEIPWSFHLEHILQDYQLTCFGSSIPPGDLASHLQRMQPKPTCKLIHLRTSGVVLDRLMKSAQPSRLSASLYTYKYGDDLTYKSGDVYDFARWAFSADGLPNLQVLAWGDFSYGGRYSKFNLLLCKSDNGYQTLSSSDIISWNLVREHMDMLAACPFDDILE